MQGPQNDIIDDTHIIPDFIGYSGYFPGTHHPSKSSQIPTLTEKLLLRPDGLKGRTWSCAAAGRKTLPHLMTWTAVPDKTVVMTSVQVPLESNKDTLFS